MHSSSPAVHSSSPSDALQDDGPLGYEIRTTIKTILRRRTAVGSSGLVIQDGSWSNLAGGRSLAPPDEDDDDDAELGGWDEIQVEAPDLTDKETVVNLARIANDAYASPGDSRWQELDKYNLVSELTARRPPPPGPRWCTALADEVRSLSIATHRVYRLDGPRMKPVCAGMCLRTRQTRR